MPEIFIPRGVIPAVLLPFDSKMQIDEPAYRNHLRQVTYKLHSVKPGPGTAWPGSAPKIAGVPARGK